ncbi:MAG: undecaprenyl-diphosphate phosphatase [Clostridia bacterium]|nr:undecaprenyl-diphosphate phosphatase [Clostridia bacterium]
MYIIYCDLSFGDDIVIEILKSIFLGIVEGITEWLPISSTGHMILVDEFLKLNVSDAFKELFFVVIQLGAIIAVVMLFWNKIWPFHCKSTTVKPYFFEQNGKPLNGLQKFCNNYVYMDKISLWIKIAIASIPGGLLGIAFDDKIEEMLVGNSRAYVVAGALIVYGILFIIIESMHFKEKFSDVTKLTFLTAFLIGVAQSLALVPGTSRSGSTILGATLLGLSRTAAAEFSFFLSIPAMVGGSALKVLKFVMNGSAMSGLEWGVMIVGTLVSFIVSVLAIKFLMSYIKKHDFKAFGYYRIVLGIVVIAYFLLAN